MILALVGQAKNINTVVVKIKLGQVI